MMIQKMLRATSAFLAAALISACSSNGVLIWTSVTPTPTPVGWYEGASLEEAVAAAGFSLPRFAGREWTLETVRVSRAPALGTSYEPVGVATAVRMSFRNEASQRLSVTVDHRDPPGAGLRSGTRTGAFLLQGTPERWEIGGTEAWLYDTPGGLISVVWSLHGQWLHARVMPSERLQAESLIASLEKLEWSP